MKTYIGIDNGIGTIGIIGDDILDFIKTPIKVEQNYTKTKKNISRVDYNELYDYLKDYEINNDKILVLLERPMVNPKRFLATTTALRCLETMLICIEQLNLPYMFVDSKSWQKELLPSGIKGSLELKKASKDIGIRLFPQFKSLIEKHGDADGMLIAEWARRNNY